MLGFYERTLDLALRFRFITLMVFVATVAVTAVLFISSRRASSRRRTPAIIIGITDAAQDVRFEAMERLQRQVNDVVQADPAVAALTASVGAGGGGQTANNGRMYISLKPWRSARTMRRR